MIDDLELSEHWENMHECGAHKPPKPTKTNKQGGFEPEKRDFKKWKYADLITLPESVAGTNCFNCEYITDKKGKVGWCKHEEVHEWVTGRMCCKYWDHHDVKRKY